MADSVTWISFGPTHLISVLAANENARVGYVVDGDITDAYLANLNSIKTHGENVFVDANYQKITDAGVLACADAGYPLEVWTVNTGDAQNALNPYVSGITTDSMFVWNTLRSVT